MNTVFSSWGSAARLPRALLAAGVVCAALVVANPARAQSEASAALSMLPVASVVGTASVASAAAGAVVTVPAALSVGGAVLTVRAVEASAVGTVYLLERASDGAQVSVEVVGRGVAGSAYAVGTVVTCSVIGTGVILSAAGEAIAFTPTALRRALLYHDRPLRWQPDARVACCRGSWSLLCCRCHPGSPATPNRRS